MKGLFEVYASMLTLVGLLAGVAMSMQAAVSLSQAQHFATSASRELIQSSSSISVVSMVMRRSQERQWDTQIVMRCDAVPVSDSASWCYKRAGQAVLVRKASECKGRTSVGVLLSQVRVRWVPSLFGVPAPALARTIIA